MRGGVPALAPAPHMLSQQESAALTSMRCAERKVRSCGTYHCCHPVMLRIVLTACGPPNHSPSRACSGGVNGNTIPTTLSAESDRRVLSLAFLGLRPFSGRPSGDVLETTVDRRPSPRGRSKCNRQTILAAFACDQLTLTMAFNILIGISPRWSEVWNEAAVPFVWKERSQVPEITGYSTAVCGPESNHRKHLGLAV